MPFPTPWRPNTCGCHLMQYEDTAVMVKPCADHINDDGKVPFDENQGLGRTLDVLDKMGLDPSKVRWEFDKKGRGRRTLRIHIPAGMGVVFDPRDVRHIELVPE